MTESFATTAGDSGSGGLIEQEAPVFEADAADEHDPGTPMANVPDDVHAGPDECEVPQ